MAFSLMNGLSAAGGATAAYAATAGLEAQKSELENQRIALTDHLAQARQVQQQGFESGQAELGRQFTGSESTKAQTAAAANVATSTEAQLAAAKIGAAAQTGAASISANAPTPEMKDAVSFPNMTPAQQAAYYGQILVKSGMPIGMVSSALGQLGLVNPASGTPAHGGGSDPAAQSPSPPVSSGASTASPASPSPPTVPLVPGGAAASPSPGARSPSSPSTGKPETVGELTGQGAPQYNDAAIAGYSTLIQQRIKAVNDGRLIIPQGTAQEKGDWPWILPAVTAYNPNFDQTATAARAQTRKDYAPGGAAATAFNAMNTTLGHASDLSDAFATQANKGGPLTLTNKLTNWYSEATGKTETPTVQQLVNTVATEARKVYSGNAGTEAELDDWQKSFPVNGAPAQQQKSLSVLADMLDKKLTENVYQYNTALGPSAPPLQPLNPVGLRSFQKLTGTDPESMRAGSATALPPDGMSLLGTSAQAKYPIAAPSAPVTSGPAKGAVVGGYSFLGGDPNNPNSWAPVSSTPMAPLARP